MTDTNEINEALAGNYLLVDVTIRKFGGFKTDKDASREITTSHQAQVDSAKVTKDLMAGARAELKVVTSAQGAIRNFMRSRTMPWSSSVEGNNQGARLLPAAKSFEFLKAYGSLHKAYVAAVTDFLAVYDARRTEAMMNLGTLANAEDYPTREEVEGMFGVDLDMTPVPAVSDFDRLAIPANLAEALATRISDRQDSALKNAMSDLNDRILAELKRMAGILSRHSQGEKTKLFGSLVSNMEVLVDLLKSSNLSNNDRIDELVARLEECTAHDIETIKKNPSIAGDIATKAVELSADIESELYF